MYREGLSYCYYYVGMLYLADMHVYLVCLDTAFLQLLENDNCMKVTKKSHLHVYVKVKA